MFTALYGEVLCLYPEPEVRCVWEPVGPTTVGPGSVTACSTAPGPAGMDVLLRAHSDGEREKEKKTQMKQQLRICQFLHHYVGFHA